MHRFYKHRQQIARALAIGSWLCVALCVREAAAQDQRSVSHGGNSSSGYKVEPVVDEEPTWPASDVQLREADRWQMRPFMLPATNEAIAPTTVNSESAAQIRCRRDDTRRRRRVRCRASGAVDANTLARVRRAARKSDPYGSLTALKLEIPIVVEWLKIRSRRERLCPDGGPASRKCRKIFERFAGVDLIKVVPRAKRAAAAASNMANRVLGEGQALPPLLVPFGKDGTTTPFFQALFPAGGTDERIGRRPYFVARTLRKALKRKLAPQVERLLRYDLAVAELAIGNMAAAEQMLPSVRSNTDALYGERAKELASLLTAIQSKRNAAGIRKLSGATP